MTNRVYTPEEIDEALSRARDYFGPFDRPQMIAIIEQLRRELNRIAYEADRARRDRDNANAEREELRAAAKAKREKIAALANLAVTASWAYDACEDWRRKILAILDEETP